MKSWIEFWNADNPIYVNARHKLLHYRLIAQGIADLVPEADAVVLDYGCGEALSAGLVAARCKKLLLADAAPSVREKLNRSFGEIRSIHVLSPDEVRALTAGSVDLVVIHSVAQYLGKTEFSTLIGELADKLKPGGSLVIGDILPNGLPAITDAMALIRFAFEGGFFFPALLGLARTALSDYRKLRGELGLTHYDEAEMLAMLDHAGLTARRLEKNIGHNQARMAFGAVKFREPEP